jgi:hypothetical protein
MGKSISSPASIPDVAIAAKRSIRSGLVSTPRRRARNRVRSGSVAIISPSNCYRVVCE